jgi:hypothetical protein
MFHFIMNTLPLTILETGGNQDTFRAKAPNRKEKLGSSLF